MRLSKKDQVLRSVLAILIDKTLDTERFKHFNKDPLNPLGDCTSAVELVLKKMRPPQHIVDFVVKRYMGIFKKTSKGHSFIIPSDSLGAAARMAEYGASRKVVEQVVGAMAGLGWYGRIEGMAQRLLGRGLTEKEVLALVNACVTHDSSRSDDEERKLLEFARKYLPKHKERAVAQQLKNFKIKFNSQID